MLADADLTFGEGQLWRLILSPLVVTSFWFDIILVMPLYLCLFCYSKELQTGTLTAWLYFNLISKSSHSVNTKHSVYNPSVFIALDIALQCVSYLVCLIFAVISSDTASSFFDKDSAFFSIFVAEMLQSMLSNPNKPVDLIFVKIAQKYFIFVVLGLGHFVLPYAWTSIISVILVSISLYPIRSKHFLNPAMAYIEKIASCGRGCSTTLMGYVTAEAGLKNA